MSLVHLVPPTPQAGGTDHMMADYEIVRRSAIAGRPGEHQLTSGDAEDAELILFIGSRDPLQRDVRQHVLAKRFPERVVLYDSADWVIPFLPGIYPSIERRHFRPGRVWPGFYLRWSDAETVELTDPDTTPQYLYGFVGSAETHPVRKRVLALKRPDALIRDTTDEPGRGYSQTRDVYQAYREGYGRDLSRVRFVLCPRGVGPSSMRIFETMKAGRVPVIVSDQWVEPEGPSWSRFSLRVAEKAVERIPKMLEAISGSAPEMGRAARAAWEEWFSPRAAFQTLAGKALPLRASGRAAEWLERRRAGMQVWRWHSLRHYVVGPLVKGIIRRPGHRQDASGAEEIRS